MALGIVNTGLIALVGVIAIFRWRHLRWFPVYALTIAAFAAITILLPWIYTHELSIIRRTAGELLCLLAVVEVMRKEADGEPWWALPALLGLVVVPFLPLPLEVRYYLPQDIFALGLALELPQAINKKSAPLLGWSVIGAATLVSDILKISIPTATEWNVLIFLDPLWFTAMGSIMLVGALWPEVDRYLVPLAGAVRDGWRRLDHALSRQPATAGNLNGGTPGSGVIRQFPLAGTGADTGIRAAGRGNVDAALEEIIDRLDALEASLETAAMLSVRLNKTFLSPADLASYLGVSEETARRFVDTHDISRIQLTDNLDEWVVFRADVDNELGDA